MKTQIHKTVFATYFMHEEQHVLEQLWTNEEQNMTDENYKEDMWNYLKYVEERQVGKALINLQSFCYTIAPELQSWVDQNITSKAGEYVKKIAFVMPTDFIESLSVQQTMSEEAAESKLTMGVSYFDKDEDAMNWLLN